MVKTGKGEPCPMTGGSTRAQLQFCLAAVLNDQPSKDGTANILFLGFFPRGSSRDAKRQVGKKE